MSWTVFTAMIGVMTGLSGIILGWMGRARSSRQDIQADASNDAALKIDVEYIKRGVDDVRVEQRIQGQRFDQLSERVTRVEESAKSAHHRLDEWAKSKIGG
jgi:hypothetical protein